MFKKLFHFHLHSKPVVSKYVSFHTRDIIYECKCGDRKIFRRTFEFSEKMPIKTAMIITEKEFQSLLIKTR